MLSPASQSRLNSILLPNEPYASYFILRPMAYTCLFAAALVLVHLTRLVMQAAIPHAYVQVVLCMCRLYRVCAYVQVVPCMCVCAGCTAYVRMYRLYRVCAYVQVVPGPSEGFT